MKECVVVIGSYINACSIIWSLKKINYRNKIYVAEFHEDKARCMAEVLLNDINIIKAEIFDELQLINVINDNIPSDVYKIFLFTSEEFIEPIRHAIDNNKIINALAYTGSKVDNNLIFDRFKFYKFIERLGHSCIPKTISSAENPEENLGDSYIIRVNSSWNELKKLPRLKIVNSIEERECFESSLLAKGLTRDMWSYQELLSVSDKDNLSVCGWYDSDFKQFVVTRKILQHPPKTGNGDVVEVYKDAPRYIIDVTMDILKALEYVGPFEMEFVFDLSTNQYKVIELNPRFWMQHGLVNDITGNSLIRRALGERGLIPVDYKDVQYGAWINGNRVLYHIIKGNFEVIKYLTIGKFYPSFWGFLKWMLYYLNYKHVIK